ncbi:MAG: DUF3667 domain-containing protein [Gemmatimonadota bacterium]
MNWASCSRSTGGLRGLRLLFRRPGFLTNEFIAGRRASYLAPFRLYLVISLVYFLVLAATGFDTFFFVTAQPDSLACRYMRLLPRLMFVILPAFAGVLELLYPRRLYVERSTLSDRLKYQCLHSEFAIVDRTRIRDRALGPSSRVRCPGLRVA